MKQSHSNQSGWDAPAGVKEGRERSGSPVRWNEAHSTLDPFSASHIIPVWSTQPAPCQSLVTPLCPGRKRFPSPGECPPPGTPFFSQPLLGAWPRTDQRDRGKAQGAQSPPSCRASPGFPGGKGGASGGDPSTTAGPYSLGTLYQRSHLLFPANLLRGRLL